MTEYEAHHTPQQYYRLWIRLLGLCERKTHRLVVWPLHNKATSLKAKPPPESKHEIRESRLLSKLKHPVAVFSDGAHSWPVEVRATRAKHAACQHNQHQYTASSKLQAPVSALAGTQCIDTRWGVLVNSFMPVSLKAKARDDNGISMVNQRIFIYAWSFALRYNFNAAQRQKLWNSLGTAVAEVNAAVR